MPNPQTIATWRFEMISPLVDESLSLAEKHKALKERSSRPVIWPSGEEKPIPRSTLYCWFKAYRKSGLEGLVPKRRKDWGTSRTDRSKIIEKAIALLLERPARSLTLLLVFLKTQKPDLCLTRATLSRDLKRHPCWSLVQRLRNRERRVRRRFQATVAHQIWQLDAKGSFEVRMSLVGLVRVTILTVLDDFSRAVLAYTVSRTEDLAAAVRVFRRAAARWGLPHKVYSDRHSTYDSECFRRGLATLGVHRIASRAGNAPARGKIEAYHRPLDGWFIDELPHQEVIDDEHLEQLLGAMIELVYQTHYHRTLRQSPAEALQGRRSSREVSPQDLKRAFWVEKDRKAHPKTGEIDLPAGLFLVPHAYVGKRVRIRWDPDDTQHPVLLDSNDREIPLKAAFETPAVKKPREPQRGCGRLQQLLDVWQGRELPQASPGYGLPEIFEALGLALDRSIPGSEAEAMAILDFYQTHGPFRRLDFDQALARTLAALGPQRPLPVLLDYLIKLTKKPITEPEKNQ